MVACLKPWTARHRKPTSVSEQAIARLAADENQKHATMSLQELMRYSHHPTTVQANKGLYMITNGVSAQNQSFPGAVDSASWWHRNCRMYANVQAVAKKRAHPGHRRAGSYRHSARSGQHRYAGTGRTCCAGSESSANPPRQFNRGTGRCDWRSAEVRIAEMNDSRTQVHHLQKKAPRVAGCFQYCAGSQALNGWRNRMVSLRSGPVEITSMGTPSSCSMRCR